MHLSPHGRATPKRHSRGRRAASLSLAVLVTGGAVACTGETLITYPEATAGSVPEETTSTDPTSSTRRTTTSRGAGTSRSTTTRGGRTTKPPNPTYADYCQTFVEKVSAAASAGTPAEEFAAQKKALRELAAVAPAPIKADMKTFADYAQSATDASQMRESQMPGPVKAANDRLDKWHTDNCGLGD
jgi:hypothetical protein